MQGRSWGAYCPAYLTISVYMGKGGDDFALTVKVFFINYIGDEPKH